MTTMIRAVRSADHLSSGVRDAHGTSPCPRQCASAEEIVVRLENAGATLLAMPHTGPSTRMRQMKFDIVQTALESYGWEAEWLRAPVPDAAAISAMDEAFGWLRLIPESRFVLRRIVGARSLVHPLTGRHLFPWRRLATTLGADHKSVQRWHGDGIAYLERRLVVKERSSLIS